MTNILELPFVTWGFSASQDAGCLLNFGFGSQPVPGGPVTPIDTTGIVFSAAFLTSPLPAAPPYPIALLAATDAAYLSNGNASGVLSLNVPQEIMWGIAPGTYTADLVASADGYEIVVGQFAMTVAVQGPCLITSSDSVTRNAASANSVGYVPGPAWNQFRGNYSTATNYIVNDVVFSGVSSWIATAPSLNQAPAVGSPCWNLIAEGLDPTALNAAVESASGSETASAGSAAAAQVSAGQAASSATTASSEAAVATSQAGAAATSAVSAASSATAAAGSASSASTAATNTAALLASFRSLYLGAFATDAAAAAYASSNGVTLTSGVMYENTAETNFRIYLSGAWQDFDADAEASQAAAALSATNAAASAASASTSAGTATTQAANAQTSATAAANSATAAAGSATSASNSATTASAAAGSATTQATAAGNSASAAAGSATSASGSASTAMTQASAASTSASNAASSAAAAGNSASAAATSATNAAASAITAQNYATGFSIGTVTAGTAAATITGSPGNQKLNLVIPTSPYTLPAATASTLGGVEIGSNLTVSSAGVLSLSSSNVTAALGFAPLSAVPAPSASVLGGVFAATGSTNQFQTGINTSGAPTFAQPAFSNLSGTATAAQLPTGSASALGILQVGSNISISGGLISLSAANVTAALGYTPLNLAGGTMTGALAVPGLSVPSGTLSYAAAAASDVWNPTSNAVTGVSLSASTAWQTLTYGSTIAWAMTGGTNFRVTLTGNATMGTPVGMLDGRTYLLQPIQDPTGSRTISWPSIFDFGAAGVPTLTTTANGRDLIFLAYDATLGKFLCSIAKGF